MKNSKFVHLVLAGGAGLLLAATAAGAAEVKISGTSVHVNTATTPEKLADGRTLLRLSDKAMLETSDPKSPLNYAARNCSGTVILDASGKPVDGAGFCETFDKDNEGYWSTWFFTPKGAQWDAFHGTGKYEGITGTGMAQFLANYPDRYIVHFEGTLNMK